MTTRKKRPTKAEIAAANFAAEQAEIRAALRWLDEEPPKPDIPIPDDVYGDENGITTGWVAYGGGDYARAEPAWSGTVHHGVGSHTPKGSASQGGRALYSSKAAALRAARHEAAMTFARRLWEIDKKIAKAEK